MECFCCVSISFTTTAVFFFYSFFYQVKHWFPLRDCGCAALCLSIVTHLYTHTQTPHPCLLSSTAQQQLWLSSQTIRTAHITTHDTHKLSTQTQMNVAGDCENAGFRHVKRLHLMNTIQLKGKKYK